VSSIPTATQNKGFELVRRISSNKINAVSWGNKFTKGVSVLASRNLDELYKGLVSNWKDPHAVVIGAVEPQNLFSSDVSALSNIDDISKMMVIDSISYLPDDILVKVDRAAMGVSLETRVPFLDHHIFEFAWRLPQSMKLNQGVGKSILREVLYRYVPKELIERPKMGFGVPIGDWIRGPLREWADDLLHEDRLILEGFFYPNVVRKMWSEHLNGKKNWECELWNILMFQAWLDNQ
jgi:asparagine synthase (glutamine-hydrolysing)